ncbi:MAG: hypothetical protein ACWA5X_09940, partial [bacterium]
PEVYNHARVNAQKKCPWMFMMNLLIYPRKYRAGTGFEHSRSGTGGGMNRFIGYWATGLTVLSSLVLLLMSLRGTVPPQ